MTCNTTASDLSCLVSTIGGGIGAEVYHPTLGFAVVGVFPFVLIGLIMYVMGMPIEGMLAVVSVLIPVLVAGGWLPDWTLGLTALMVGFIVMQVIGKYKVK